MSNDILSHAEAGVMTITLNRLDRKNSITSAMYGAMADALAAAEADPALRVVVFQGHETVFCAGNDIGDFLNQPPAGMESPYSRAMTSASYWPTMNRNRRSTERSSRVCAISCAAAWNSAVR